MQDSPDKESVERNLSNLFTDTAKETFHMDNKMPLSRTIVENRAKIVLVRLVYLKKCKFVIAQRMGVVEELLIIEAKRKHKKSFETVK